MEWSPITGADLIRILEQVADEGSRAANGCVDSLSPHIEAILERQRSLGNDPVNTQQWLPLAETGTHRRTVRQLYEGCRMALYELNTAANRFYSFGGVLHENDAERAITELYESHVFCGVQVFVDGNMIRIRTPVTPEIGKTTVWPTGKNGGRPIKDLGLYASAVRRAMSQKLPEILPILPSLERKTIHYLFASHDHGFLVENHDRDTADITNSICSFLPGGDSAGTTRFVYESCVSGPSHMFSGTFITVLPYEQSIPDFEQTLGYWKDKFRQIWLDYEKK